MERIYKSMRNIGAANIAIGIILVVVGISTGVVSIVTGARLVRKKSELTF